MVNRGESDTLELRQAQILGHDEYVLPMLVRSQNLGPISDDQNTIVGVK